MTTQAEKTDLVITHIFDAPVERVWQAWTDAADIKQWWGPDGFTAPLAQMDVRVGGTSLVCMSHPDFGTNYSTWDYKEIVPQTRLAFVHNLADEHGKKLDPVAIGMPSDFPVDQLQVITFKALGEGKTELTVTEYGWTPGQMMEMSRMGMEQCLNKMAAIL